ncbi:MAG: glycosyltransferase family 4 protein, partial [Sedimentisphaerales bacterium]
YKAFSDAGAEIVNIGRPLDVGKKKARFFRSFSLARMVKKAGCNVLLSRAGMTNRLTGYAGMLNLVPTVAVLSGRVGKHVLRLNFFKQFAGSIGIAFRLGFPTRIVAVSLEAANNFSCRYPLFSKYTVAIQNGIDMPKSKSDYQPPNCSADDSFTICYAGSLEIDRKGLDILIDAMKKIIFEYRREKLLLILIGAGEDEQSLKDMIRVTNLNKYVTFAGEMDDPLPKIRTCDAFVLPSRREGFPNALLEAMSVGVCCIASDCDTGPREIITNGVDGLLVPVNDSAKLAETIDRVIRDSDLRERLGRGGMKTVYNNFSLSKMADSYFELLVSLI